MPAPNPPTGLSATALVKGKARLSFTDPVDAVYHRVYKNLMNDSAGATLAGFVMQGAQVFDLTGLPNNTLVYLWLKSVNSSDLVSAFSTGTSVLTLPARRVRDEEVYEDEYIAILKGGLAAKFAEITTEKNDSVVLPTIEDSEWLKDLSSAYNNRGAFVICAIEDSVPTESQKGGGGTARDIVMRAFLFAPKTNDPDARVKVLRTSRAFRELLEENWRVVNAAGPPRIEALTPETVQLQGDGSTYWAGGIRFTFTIA